MACHTVTDDTGPRAKGRCRRAPVVGLLLSEALQEHQHGGERLLRKEDVGPALPFARAGSPVVAKSERLETFALRAGSWSTRPARLLEVLS